MRRSTVLACLGLLGVLVTSAAVAPNDLGTGSSAPLASDAKPGPKLETLLKAELEGVDGIEVIVSRVTIPPHTTLPKHWHPGEEFAYVVDGTATLWQEGKSDTVGKAGDVLKVALKQVHTAMTTDQGATLLVFRVHEKGQPERVEVE